MSQEPYNPLAKSNLGESVAEALLRVPVRPLNDIKHLVGAGVYAIYYTGEFAAYVPIASRNRDALFLLPIYVGKAVPKGARKGGLGFDASKGYALRNRLKQHASSISEAHNLDLIDFHYRALTVDDVWIPLGENVVIEKYQPLWNRVIDGFGNKTPGRRRATQMRSSWDVLHPGRKFVDALDLAANPFSTEEIVKKVADFFEGNLPDAEKISSENEDEDEDDL
ncbi:Eco29kI family restriction endonuclease [Jeongeupia naejangsanensis]|uniref:Eco29kI family restriction endonuclease n=1 Tax=Jeongeupia naejangsanensis TaxID=613195 RepID=A0ABS2BFM0_9NEIS|nr:Eco29kI family restriction endonuclease [Jeongeupia naejangsanensis]MBM3114250.1 Eco29kI family restriction endonuclease [Jeongeupia naejangsanensis]